MTFEQIVDWIGLAANLIVIGVCGTWVVGFLAWLVFGAGGR